MSGASDKRQTPSARDPFVPYGHSRFQGGSGHQADSDLNRVLGHIQELISRIDAGLRTDCLTASGRQESSPSVISTF
jgi:hypothetical protein